MRLQRLRTQSIASITFALGALLALISSKPEWEWFGFAAPSAVLLFGIVRGVQALMLRRRSAVLGAQIELDQARRALGVRTQWRWLSSPKELQAFHELCEATMDDPHAYPSLPSLRKRLLSNRALIYGMLASRSNGNRLDAAFVVYPLTESAYEKYLDGTWDNSRLLEPRHIARSWPNAKAIYVAALVGRAGGSRKEVLEELLRFIDLYGHLPVLGRRGTAEGERVMVKVGMTPIVDEDGVWILRR